MKMPPIWNYTKKLLMVLLLTGVFVSIVDYIYYKPSFRSSYRVYERIGAFISEQFVPPLHGINKTVTTTTTTTTTTAITITTTAATEATLIEVPKINLGQVIQEAAGDIDANDVCVPTQHVLFLKTHKTGSSTVTNILNRYAEARNLTMLLPRERTFYSFNWPNKFRLRAAEDIFSGPNFLANHARYSRDTMNVIFPRESTFYISILRHPVKQWESTFNYFKFSRLLHLSNREDPLDYFLDHKIPSYEIERLSKSYPTVNLLRNPQFFDFGLDLQFYENSTYIDNAIQTLDHDFDLVLLMEHFDESLTLLRRRLCWDIDDVVYFKLNERLNKQKRKKEISRKHVDEILKWNNADNALYEYFQRKFWNEVEKEGVEFHEDVEKLRQRREYYVDACIEKPAIEEAYASVFVQGYKLYGNLSKELKSTCERMLRNEIHFLDNFRSAHKKWKAKLDEEFIENFKTPISYNAVNKEISVVTPNNINKEKETTKTLTEQPTIMKNRHEKEDVNIHNTAQANSIETNATEYNNSLTNRPTIDSEKTNQITSDNTLVQRKTTSSSMNSDMTSVPQRKNSLKSVASSYLRQKQRKE